MKNDINLLYKRKVKTYSSKNIIVLLLIVIIIGVVAIAAFTLPSLSLQSEKAEAARIKEELNASMVDMAELASKGQQKSNLDMILAELNALNASKADIIKYLEVIESQRPSNIIVINLTTDETGKINLGGVTDSDDTLALFCLNLREQKDEQGQKIFKDVFLISSITDPYNKATLYNTSFGIIITLPSPLGSTTIIQEIEHKDDVTANKPVSGGN